MPVNSIPIVLDKERHLRFDFNALCLMEEALNKSVDELLPYIGGKKISVRILRAILWAGLVHEDESLTVSQTGDILQDIFSKKGPKVFAELGSTVKKAVDGAFKLENDTSTSKNEKKAEGTE